MKKISLEDVLPKHPKFRVEAMGKEFSIRPPTLADQIWLKRKFVSAERVQQIFTQMDWENITRIVYHQLNPAGREAFKAQKVNLLDDEGRSATVDMSGPGVLLAALGGTREALKMLGAMNRAFIIANPEVEEELTEQVKKNLKAIQTLQEQIGQESSTSSAPNTAGQIRKSSKKRRGESI